LQKVLSDLEKVNHPPGAEGAALECPGLDEALAMLMHQAVLYRRRSECLVCAKNSEAGQLFWENMKEPGHTCAADTTPPKPCSAEELAMAEDEILRNRLAEAFLLINQQANASQIVWLKVKEYFASNRMCFSEDVSQRLVTHRTYTYDPFGRKIDALF
jgi:hypothetical protein